MGESALKKRDRVRKGVEERCCYACREWLPLEASYTRDPNKQKGRKHICRGCMAIKRAGGNPKIHSGNRSCPKGHPWFEPGVGYYASGEIACLICRNTALERRVFMKQLNKAKRKEVAA